MIDVTADDCSIQTTIPFCDIFSCTLFYTLFSMLLTLFSLLFGDFTIFFVSFAIIFIVVFRVIRFFS